MNNIDVQALAQTIAQAVTVAVVAALDESQPAKTTAPKARASKPAAKAGTKRALTKGNRKEFVQAHPWAQGLSTRQIAEKLASGERRCKAGWRLGEGYKALVK